ncbi:benzoylformate decarboxylase [Roseibium aggregatum]|uniref:benzoylformate decarboxylase n=1 Tax=Roseibium aggregatum TaxID=187304 RepID=UPI0025AC46AA|nr:benzoylformate decarboxylase [Roseibium aggregatum]WJS00966.1 benzoylformate decarboxylase [Roseibium aggregatum]
MPTVKDVTFDLLRKLGLTTIVGNPGSTEETFLKNFPDDFRYVLSLQEASVVGIADGLAQGLRKPVIVNVHTGAGLGNAMGCILTAYQNKTPLILTAGQQTRDMLLLEPLLTNINATLLPQPWVKWSYEPARAQDVPAAFMRAYAAAIQQPSGPVFLSLPLDDWDKEMEGPAEVRSVSLRSAADPARIKDFAERINAAKTPVLVYGSDIARSEAWDEGIAFAEALSAPVLTAPFAERTPFPESHRLHAGTLPSAIGPICKRLEGHDLVITVGAPVFRYYPYVAGDYLPAGTKLLQVTDDPDMAAKAPVGDSLVSDSRLFLQAILPQLDRREEKPNPYKKDPAPVPDYSALPLTPDAVYSLIREAAPSDFVLVEESPSNVIELERQIPIDKPDTFYTFASGGLGWDMPAAVGLAIAEETSGRNRPVIAVIGDGSFQYSVQSIYTGVQEEAHVVFVAMRNSQYAILKEFAILEETPNVPGLDLPGLDIEALGRGYGAKTAKVKTADEFRASLSAALAHRGTTVIEVEISPKLRSLLG